MKTAKTVKTKNHKTKSKPAKAPKTAKATQRAKAPTAMADEVLIKAIAARIFNMDTAKLLKNLGKSIAQQDPKNTRMVLNQAAQVLGVVIAMTPARAPDEFAAMADSSTALSAFIGSLSAEQMAGISAILSSEQLAQLSTLFSAFPGASRGAAPDPWAQAEKVDARDVHADDENDEDNEEDEDPISPAAHVNDDDADADDDSEDDDSGLPI